MCSGRFADFTREQKLEQADAGGWQAVHFFGFVERLDSMTRPFETAAVTAPGIPYDAPSTSMFEIVHNKPIQM